MGNCLLRSSHDKWDKNMKHLGKEEGLINIRHDLSKSNRSCLILVHRHEILLPTQLEQRSTQLTNLRSMRRELRTSRRSPRYNWHRVVVPLQLHRMLFQLQLGTDPIATVSQKELVRPFFPQISPAKEILLDAMDLGICQDWRLKALQICYHHLSTWAWTCIGNVPLATTNHNQLARERMLKKEGKAKTQNV